MRFVFDTLPVLLHLDRNPITARDGLRAFRELWMILWLRIRPRVSIPSPVLVGGNDCLIGRE